MVHGHMALRAYIVWPCRIYQVSFLYYFILCSNSIPFVSTTCYPMALLSTGFVAFRRLSSSLCFIFSSLVFFLSFSDRLLVLSSPVCLVLSCHILSCRILSCPVLSCLVVSCPVLLYPVLSCPVLSCPVVSCRILSCSASVPSSQIKLLWYTLV